MERIRRSGYSGTSFEFSVLNGELSAISRQIADSRLSASSMLGHAKALQRIAPLCKKFERGENSDSTETSEQNEETQSTITRAEFYLEHLKMCDKVIQNWTTALHNRMNESDSTSMKTIAVVTLLFLPSTFVSTVFSSGIFNFHANEEAPNEKVVSKYGWIYLMLCLLLTAIAFIIWFSWYFYGGPLAEKMKR